MFYRVYLSDLFGHAFLRYQARTVRFYVFLNPSVANDLLLFDGQVLGREFIIFQVKRVINHCLVISLLLIHIPSRVTTKPDERVQDGQYPFSGDSLLLEPRYERQFAVVELGEPWKPNDILTVRILPHPRNALYKRDELDERDEIAKTDERNHSMRTR